MQQQIEQDLKAALLAGDKSKAETLRVIKSALIYEAVNKGLDRSNLTDEQAQSVLARESKKRQEAADIYKTASQDERAAKELAEKQIIDAYLPKQLSETEIAELVQQEVAKLDSPSMKDMGTVMGVVRAKAGPTADGAMIAKLVKDKLS